MLLAGDSPPIVVPLEDEVFLTGGGGTNIGARAAVDEEGNFLGLHFDQFSGFIAVRGGTPAGLEPAFGIGPLSWGAGLAALGDGEFVISWSEYQYPLGLLEHVFLRRYEVDGTPVGPEVQVTDEPIEAIAARTAVAVRPDSFFVAWEDWTDAPQDVAIRGRIVPFAGAPAASFPVSSSAGQQTDPRLATQADGSALAVWSSDDCAPEDPSGGCIRARHFDPSGAPSGPAFTLNSETTDQQNRPAVAAAGDGFVAVWLSVDCGSNCVRGRRVDATGTPVGGDFRVDEAGGSAGPGVGGRDSGSFVVAWRRVGGGDWLTYGRAFNASGAPLTGEFQVNTSTSSLTLDPDVAMNAAGGFVVVWSNDYELWSRRFELHDELFEDGFESGDTSAWSTTIP
jgi:hypothetical protein